MQNNLISHPVYLPTLKKLFSKTPATPKRNLGDSLANLAAHRCVGFTPISRR